MTTTRTGFRGARAVALGVSLSLAAAGALAAAAPASAATDVVVHPGDIASTPSGAGWAKNGDVAITADGATITGASQLAYLFDEATAPTGSALRQLANAGAIGWSLKAGSAPATFQLPVRLGDGDIVVLTPATPATGDSIVDVEDEWLSDGAIPSTETSAEVLPDTATPLAEILAGVDANDSHLLGFGLLGSAGQTSVVTGVRFDSTSYTFALPPLTAGTASISGTAKVGEKLTANTAGWPEGTTFTYQWTYSGGEWGNVIEGATASTLTLTDALAGMRVSVFVTGHKDGFAPTEVSSAATGWVAAPQKPAAAAPVATSDGLPAYFAANGVTVQSPSAAGLPGSLDPAKGYAAPLQWAAGDSFVDVYAYSTPVLIGTFPVVNGVAQISLTAAQLSAVGTGAHTLVVIGQSTGLVQGVSFTVAVVPSAAGTSTAVLANTGADLTGPALAGALLLLVGAGLLIVRRRMAARA